MYAILKPALLAILLAGPALAEGQPRQITVTGEGKVSAAPDLAWINVGVSHRAKTAQEAVAAMSAGMSAVIAELVAAGIAETDIQTGQLSLYPFYDDLNATPTQQVLGYDASITVDVRVRDLDRTGAILDAVVSEGANTFGGIRFELTDPATAYAEARRAAVADGRAKAELYADAAGVTLGPLVTLSENNFYSQPVMAERRFAADAAPVPVSPGEVSYSVSVMMVYKITD
jgi:uncharacterized protein YggE